jgi:hypothetical protein
MDPTVPCDTHNAIKCGCDGTGAPHSCLPAGEDEAAAAAAASAGDITCWAHLRDASASPDVMWGHMSSWIRERYVTYLFSDHTVNGAAEPAKQQAGDEEEEEEEQEGMSDEDDWQQGNGGDDGSATN